VTSATQTRYDIPRLEMRVRLLRSRMNRSLEKADRPTRRVNKEETDLVWRRKNAIGVGTQSLWSCVRPESAAQFNPDIHLVRP